MLSPTAYLEVVGEHGTMMMMMMTSVVLGPFGNYLVPIMIGSKRVAFPRLEALSFWLTPCAFVILLSSFLLGGFPTGWTGYAPLSIQAGEGMDAYAFAFGLMGISIILAGFNIIVTIICYRAPGMRWARLPMFVWSMLTTGFLLVLAAPVLVGGMYMIITDRTAQTAFFINQLGGSSYLYQDLFWFFGHPEVYILALPGFGIVCEILPVFTRKPLFGYKIAAAGMFGVAILSFFVWQHHLFMSGINPDMRPLFMLTTELISIPTGFIFLVALGTFWKAKIRLTVPMLFAMALFVNFLFGGISGVFLSDVPADTTAHGSFFVMAHFHYTIMGGLIFAFFGGIYYWLPKIMGITLNQRLGKIHFWTMFITFNSTFMPLFAVGMLGQPRRVFEYARNLETLNDWVSISAFCLGVLDAHLHLQLRDVHGGLARARAAEPVAGARPGVADPLAAAAGELHAHPGGAGGPVRVRRPERPARGGPEPAGRGDRRRADRSRGEYHHERRIGGVTHVRSHRPGQRRGRCPGDRGERLLPRGGAQRGVDGQQAGARRAVVPVRGVRVRLLLPAVRQRPLEVAADVERPRRRPGTGSRSWR